MELPWSDDVVFISTVTDMWLSNPIRKWLANKFGNQFRSKSFLMPNEASWATFSVVLSWDLAKVAMSWPSCVGMIKSL